MWPDRRILDLFKTEFPIVLAPMAGVLDADLVIAAAQGGALGSLPCAMFSPEKAREQINIIRQRVSTPLNLNFFCSQAGRSRPRARGRMEGAACRPITASWGSIRRRRCSAANRAPFDDAICALVEELKPEIVSFHFGLPDAACWSASRRPAAS